jgi:hypothetical protein
VVAPSRAEVSKHSQRSSQVVSPSRAEVSIRSVKYPNSLLLHPEQK